MVLGPARYGRLSLVPSGCEPFPPDLHGGCKAAMDHFPGSVFSGLGWAWPASSPTGQLWYQNLHEKETDKC